MNIVLIGYRGSGKSTVARLLASKTGMKNISSDALIEEKARMTISEFVKNFGWNKFRDLEEEVIKEIAGMDSVVIDTGGGIILRQSNIDALKKKGIIFFLNANPKILAERIKRENTRPPLTYGKEPWEEVEIVLRERLPLYKKAADYLIENEETTPEEVVEKIIKIIKNSEI